MSQMSRGRIEKPKRSMRKRVNKVTTVTEKKHRFEPFSRRIARLTINPVRGNDDLQKRLNLDDTESHFRNALEEWKDRNLSRNFISFTHEIDKLSQSLPQILHFRREIVDILLKYVAKADHLSLEPLTSLLVNFAHDLGARFEPYFENTVSIVSNIAATHANVEVIEWSFNSLAWLFKFLSRLLVSDLRPLFDFMKPLLGKTHQKFFVKRFAAESLSYLLRKAAASHYKNSEPLERIVRHVFRDLDSCDLPQQAEYQYGLAALFSGTIKGVQRGVHSSATAVFGCLLDALMDSSTTSAETYTQHSRVTRCVLVDVVHQTDPAGFEPILSLLLGRMDKLSANASELAMRSLSDCLYIILSTRKGSRIADWSRIFLNISGLVRSVTSSMTYAKQSLGKVVAATISFADPQAMTENLEHLLDAMDEEVWSGIWLQIYNTVARISQERFDSFLLPYFGDFVIKYWQREKGGILSILPSVSEKTILRGGESAQLFESQLRQDLIGHLYEARQNRHGTETDMLESVALVYGELATVKLMPPASDVENQLLEELKEAVKSYTSKISPNTDSTHLENLLLTEVLSYLVDRSQGSDLRDLLLLHVLPFAHRHYHRPRYMAAIASALTQFRTSDTHFAPEELEAFFQLVMPNLSSPSHLLRLHTLRAIVAAHEAFNVEVPDSLRTALLLEESPFTLDRARGISMDIRKLASLYKKPTDVLWVRNVIPMYCFGLLHVRLTSAWNDALDVLDSISRLNNETQDFIATFAIAWISETRAIIEAENDADEAPIDSLESTQLTDTPPEMSCPNLSRVDSICAEVSKTSSSPFSTVKKSFLHEMSNEPHKSSSNREQGLKVLRKMPQLAEKRSRILSPTLLELVEDSRITDDEEEHDFKVTAEIWTRHEQISLVELFSDFQNPTVLYRSEEVRTAMLKLLSNGDIQMQKAALKALATWKNMPIKKYQENLANLLDEARLREELAVFLDVEADDSVIQAHDRATLMPVVLRLLYGRIVSRTGSHSGSHNKGSKRNAVILTLARFGTEVTSDFLSIALGPLDGIRLIDNGHIDEIILGHELLPARKQVGMLRLLITMINSLGATLSPFAVRLLNAILYCALRLSREIIGHSSSMQDGIEVPVEEDSLTRVIRQEALRAINLVFENCEQFNRSFYAGIIADKIFRPRIDQIAVETAQGVSSYLKIIGAWSKSIATAHLLTNDMQLLKYAADSLTIKSVRVEVQVYVLEHIIQELLQTLAKSDHQDIESVALAKEALKDGLAAHVLCRIRQACLGADKECIQASVQTLIALAPYASRPEDMCIFIEISTNFLNQPARLVNPRMKGEVLQLVQSLALSLDAEAQRDVYEKAISTFAKLFSYFQDNHNRALLVQGFLKLTQHDQELQKVARLCEEINAFSSKRANEPDFERRLNAFGVVSKAYDIPARGRLWEPIVHNLLFYIKEEEELAIRSSASSGLKQVISLVASDPLEDSMLQEILHNAIMPDVQKGMRAGSELVRAEYVALLATTVKSGMSEFQDLAPLLGPDEEASFFNNILHIQQHRRIRALKRLADDATKISSKNLARFCLPLVETYIDNTDETASNLTSTATSTLDALAEGLEWHRYRALLERKLQDACKTDSKLAIKALGSVVNAIARTSSILAQKNDEYQTDSNAQREQSTLARTLPSPEQLADTLSKRVLPKIMERIHYKDETTIDLRVVYAITAVKIILTLSDQQINIHLPAVLLDVCNILRSRAQEARDSARKTLSEITAIIGAKYFKFIVKSLRSALLRGYQLHVLSYTIHSLINAAAETFKIGSLDDCLKELMPVIVEDTFGTIAQEKDAQGYISQMKEVKKKSLGFDTIEKLASITTLSYVYFLLRPVQEHLETPKPKLDKVDELLRRVREGLRRNPSIKSQDFLVLCYEILKEAQKQKIGQTNSLTSVKMSSFAFELLRRVLDKYEELKTVQNLHGFMPMLSVALTSPNEEVQLTSMRWLTSIIKVPLTQIDEEASDIIRRTKGIIDEASSTNAPLAQVALRLLSALLRERPQIVVKESQFESNISTIIDRFKLDLHEPAQSGDRERQIAAFNFLKAVLGKGILIKEIFEVMDTVREIMITSESHPVPGIARSVYSRFVLDYFPEGGRGFAKQLEFIVANLQYPNPRGKLSVMEVLVFLLNKMARGSAQLLVAEVFVPLLLIVITDENEECRSSAEALIQKVFDVADKERTKSLKVQMQRWLDMKGEPAWVLAGLLCWRLYFNTHTTATKDATTTLSNVIDILNESDETDPENIPILTGCLALWSRIHMHMPGIALTIDSSSAWQIIPTLLEATNQAMLDVSATTLSTLLADVVRTTAKQDAATQWPLHGSETLTLSLPQAQHLIRASFHALQAEPSAATTDTLIKTLAIFARLPASSETRVLLTTLLSESSTLIRRETGISPPRAKVAALRLTSALCKTLPVSDLSPSLHSLLLTLQNLTDDAVSVSAGSSDTSFKEVHDELVELARELLASLQERLGTEAFVKRMHEVQKEVRARREERRAKRAVDAVAAPERAERKRVKKYEREKGKRREKNALAAGRRRGY